MILRATMSEMLKQRGSIDAPAANGMPAGGEAPASSL
jgi:hypothetical protein